MSIPKTCLRCGGTDLQSGQVQSTGKVSFRPDKAKFFTLRTSDVEMKAYICMECGTLNLVGDVEKTSRLTGGLKPER